MDPSALENVSRSLESSLDFWGVLILVSTGVVVVGLIIEYWEPVWEFVEEWLRPAAAFPWKKFMGLFGGILVTLGVAGELGFTYIASRVETQLRENNHKIEDSLNLSAETAAKAAARAEASAEAAGTVADKAKEKADDADASADRAIQKAREAEEYATPRSISAQQAALIRKRIPSLKGHKMVFFGNFNETEISDFGNQMFATLDNGIMDITIGVWQAGMVTPAGMKFGYGKNRKTDFDLIVSALDEAGVEKADVLRKQSSMVGTPDDWLTITFGAKH